MTQAENDGMARDAGTGSATPAPGMTEPSREDLAELVANAREGFGLTDEQGRILEWNAAAERLTGLRRTDVLGIPVWDLMARLLPVPAPDREPAVQRARAGVVEALASGSSPWTDRPRDVTFRDPDGNLRRLEQSPFIVHTATGHRFGFTLRDVDEQRQSDELLALQRDLAVVLAGVTTVPDALQRALELLLLRDDLVDGTAYVVDPATGGTDLVAHVNIDEEALAAIAHYDADTTETARIVAGLPVYGSVTEWDPDQRELAEQSHLRSYALLPLAHEGNVIAAFIIGSVRLDAFQPAFQRALEAAAAQLGSALDRIQTAEQLRRAELRYRLLLDDIGEGAGVVDADERFLSANAAAHVIFGVPQGTLAGRSLAEFTTPEAMETVRSQTADRRAGLRGVYELEIVRPDGETRTIVVTATPSIGDSGAFEGTIGIFSDVTDQRRAEAALRESEADLRLAQAIAHVGSWTWEAPGTWRWSDEMYRIHGFEPGAPGVPGGAEWLMSILVPEDRATMAEALRDTDRPRAAQLEYRVVRPDGEVRTVLTTLETVRDEDGEVVRMVGTTQDVTDQRRAAAERRALEQQIQETQKLESLGVLAGGIAHDFNNLLVAILGNAGLALSEIPPDSAARATVREIEIAALRAADLAVQMLAYSGKGQFVVERLDINAVVSEMGRLLAASVAKHAVIRYELLPDLPSLEADATQIRQVVMNLITNASDAIGDVDGTITVRTFVVDVAGELPGEVHFGHALAPGRHVAVSVSDTGVGMDEETRERIFDPFFSTKSTGRGLGLAAVLGIVRGHHGGMLVDSEPGRGSTFTVLLPAAAPGPVPAEERPRETTGIPHSPPRGGCILVVDDEPSVRGVASRILERAGYQVRQAADGTEAIELARADPDAIDAVLLDLSMPHMGGEGTYRALRALRADLPIVLTSGYAEDPSVAAFAGPGLAGFIGKPYHPDALVAKIAAAVASVRPEGPAEAP